MSTGAASAWDRAYAFVLVREGGFSNNPRDPGGPTYRGLSQRTLVGLDLDDDGNLDFDLDHDGDVDLRDLLELRRRVEGGDVDAAALMEGTYRARWWRPVHADAMPWPWPLLVFDASVNHGPGPAVVMLQRALGIKQPDGLVGPITIDGILDRGTAAAQTRYLVERAHLYARLAVRDADKLAEAEAADVLERVERVGLAGTFYMGWMARLFELKSESEASLE